MTPTFDPERDLTLVRTIRAPRARVWDAFADPRKFEKWWLPAPALCEVVAMEMRPGGALKTRMSEDGKRFEPHMDACFLAVDENERIVFTDALTGGWRPSPRPFITATLTLADIPEGTRYAAHVMHADRATRDRHNDMGFADGWGTVVAQLARLVEPAA
jgi:uncharacterized protein YndB with AHSA1/START domain